MTAAPIPPAHAAGNGGHDAPSPGRFLTLEGIDGAGKSSHLAWAAERLRARGLEVVTTREPGGTPLAERVRALLLGEPMAPDTETLLVFAARAEHLARVIEPALARGAWVISDRFTDATYAYQCHGRGLDADRIATLERWVQKGRHPDRTWLFDVPPAVAADRRAGRAGESAAAAATAPDRFESESDAFHRRVRDGYLARAGAEPGRFLVVDGRGSIDAIRATLAEDLDRLAASSPGAPR